MMEGLNIVHLGDLGHKLPDAQIEKLGNVDVLMIPVGGKFTIDGEEAMDIIKEIQPSYVIPMHYKTVSTPTDLDVLATLDNFLEKNKFPLAGEPVHRAKVDLGSLPDDTQILVMNV
jgi:L-ascorbate metabolism protein UlaG (beta-lactamase superfamily)